MLTYHGLRRYQGISISPGFTVHDQYLLSEEQRHADRVSVILGEGVGTGTHHKVAHRALVRHLLLAIHRTDVVERVQRRAATSTACQII